MQLTVYQREFLLCHGLSMPWEVFHSFQVTQEKDLFPCLVCCDDPPHEQRDSSWRIGVGCSSGYLPHTAKASVYTAVCVCVCGRFFRAERRAGMASAQPLPTRTKTSHTSSSLRWQRRRQNKQTKASKSSIAPCHCKYHTVVFVDNLKEM